MAVTVLQSYPSPPGNKNIVMFNVTGPVSYAQVTNGTPPTGGQLINSRDIAGITGIEYADDGVTGNGQYNVQPIIPNVPYQSPAQYMLLRWSIASTGAEVTAGTNLSGFTARLMVWSA